MAYDNEAFLLENEIATLLERSRFLTLYHKDLQNLQGLASKKAQHLANYITTLEMYDEEDKAFIAEKLAEMVYFQNLRDKLEKIINEK